MSHPECSCHPYSEDMGGGYYATNLEPDPDCPEHFPEGPPMTTPHTNPMGREYSPEEWASAKRVGLTVQSRAVVDGEVVTAPSGPLIYATGPWHPDHARQQALKAMQAVADWQRVENAMRREWKKELPDDHPTA